MDYSTPGFPVLYHIPELIQTHVHCQWCYPAISSSVTPFSFSPQSFPASESFPMSQLFIKWPKQQNFNISHSNKNSGLISFQFTSVAHAAPWIAARQASLSITNSQSLLKLTSIESVMPSNHLILCSPLLLLPSVFPSIRVFNESVLHIRWPEIVEFQLQHQSFQWIFRTDFLQDGLAGSELNYLQ